MRPSVYILSCLGLILSPIFYSAGGVNGEVGLGPYRCGTEFLRQQRLVGAAALPAAAPSKVLAPGQVQQDIGIGTELDFPVAGMPALLSATCQFAGEHAFIFVSDREWDTNGGPVLQSDVDRLAELFDLATPADPQRGIYELSEEAFGAPPDVDGYGQIFILILDIPRTNIVGFFDPAVAAHEIPELRRDVLFLDEFSVRRQVRLASGTLAHEFQHLIHWGHDADEELWVNEGLSGYAEELNGFAEADPAAVPAFLRQPGIDLTSWPLDVQPYNYGSTYLFFSFLAERHGATGFIHSLVAEPRHGRFGIDVTFETLGIDADFTSSWGDWVVANLATGDSDFSYAALAGRRVDAEIIEELPAQPLRRTVAERWGTNNILIRIPGSLVVDFDGDDTGRFEVSAYALSDGVGHLQRFDLNDEMMGRLTVADVDSLALVVGRTSPDGEAFQLSIRRPSPTAIVETALPTAQPSATRLGMSYPNPFNRRLRIPFHLQVGMEAGLAVYASNGQHVRSLISEVLPAGAHEVEWDGTDESGQVVASGAYLIKMQTDSDSHVTPLARVTFLK